MAPDGLTAAEFAELRRLKPADAMRWMQERERGALTFSWQDMWQAEHSHHFTVSRLARLDLLQAIQDSLSRSVSGDLQRRDWMRDTEQLLRDAGWWGDKQVLDPATGKMVTTRFDPARLKLIFDTNTRQAAAAGQWERIERTKRSHPYLRYITKRDDRVRPLHAAWDNVTLPVGDAFWQTHYPPNGWRCRCRVVSVNEREYQDGKTPGGGTMIKQPPDVVTTEFVNARTGEVSRVPVGVDPGFGYNPGAARRHELDALVTAKMRQATPALAQAAQLEGLTLEAAAATYAETARLQKQTKRPALAMAPLADKVISQMNELGLEPGGRLLGLDHDGVLHTFKNHGGNAEFKRGQVPITSADVAAFPAIFNAAVLERGDPAYAGDGTPLVAGEAVFGEFRYGFIAKVRRGLITIYSLWKRKAK
ncbi:phage minor head protein [Ottowia sp. SB7-C50]|uniref:phage head morphogenesis protein n=1 Tax=Ottowia sp. SB7-C50 TaxID=3081231 RepID=UPI002952BC9D|nr:phage minor head protein [Ottowia sp. SB7-C50]WOP15776.1 phage minor head protein [Ottowia sp. SB7-C50]